MDALPSHLKVLKLVVECLLFWVWFFFWGGKIGGRLFFIVIWEAQINTTF